MSLYLMRFSYTPEAWSRLIKQPEDRRDVARAVVEKLGGRLHGFWYGFGEHDGFVLIEAPDNAAAAAFSVGIAARGSLRSAETTPLLTVEEMIEALEKAQGLPYRSPGTSS
ncbi:MAG TPA: GYD domain-containing protein [Gemmatimonadales bacterium]|nr:GYD domain-containing protein [Gemmatimonadales bacterium]